MLRSCPKGSVSKHVIRSSFETRAPHAPQDEGTSVMLLEALCQLLDIVRRPAIDLHPEMQAHLRQHFLDLVQRLAAEIRGPQHLAFALLDEVADIDDVVVLQAVRRTY